MNTQATAKNAIEIATKYQGTNGSAKICLQDAETCYARKDWEHAISRAKKSLQRRNLQHGLPSDLTDIAKDGAN